MVNEELVPFWRAWRQARTVEADGAHHEIPYREFEEVCARTGFFVRYYVAQHVLDQLVGWVGRVAGTLVTGLFERFPLLLKQLRSTLIILHKQRARQGGQEG
jgi:hypothetical protein